MPTGIHARVVDCIATATRYPKELLTPDADLESDLGIDSVKRVEITVALGEEFQLDLLDEDRDPSVRTIEDVSNWIARLTERLSSNQVEEPRNETRNQTRRVPERETTQQEVIPTRSFEPSEGEYWGTPSNPQAPRSPADVTSVGGRIDPPATKSRKIPRPHFSMPTAPAPVAPAVKPLAGRVALVTGSGRSVGRTIARVLAARGATIVVNSFHSRDAGEQTVQEIIDNGGNAIHAWGSVANPEHVRKIFAQVEQQIGYLDMLICNASDGRIGSFSDIGPEDWDRAFRTNVSGHYQCAMEARRLMQPRGGGSIVTMSAVGAHRFVDGLGSQGVVKAAVESLTKYLACELAPFGIRANCVSGGPVYGDLISKFPDAEATQNQWETFVPGGALTSPLDLANTISYLVSDDAKGINGAVWQVDQGFSAVADRSSVPNAQDNSQPQRSQVVQKQGSKSTYSTQL